MSAVGAALRRRLRPRRSGRFTSVVQPSLIDVPRWGVGTAAASYLVAIVVGNLAAGVAVAVVGDADGLPVILAGVLGLWVGFVGGPVYATRRMGSGRLQRDVGLTASRFDPLIGGAAGVATQLIAVPAVYLPITWVADVDVSAPARELTDSVTGAGLVVLIIVLVAGAPVAEELFFRGLLLRATIRRFGTVPGIAITTVVFAGTHFQLLQFPGLFVAGAVFALLAVTSGRLGPAIWAHATFNATSVVLLLA